MYWIRTPQEQNGTYLFSGTLYITENVCKKLRPIEIILIYQDIQNFVRENNGVDYFQRYINDAGEKLYLIDQLNREMIQGGNYEPEDNHCTLLFSWEY